MSYQIEVKSNGEQETIECEKGDKLLKVLLQNGYDINAYCGGEGICGKCKVQLKGDIKEPSSAEIKYLDQKEIDKGFRLSCQYEVESDLEVILEAKEDITVMTGGVITELDIDLDLSKEKISLDKATLKNQTDYLKKIYEKTATNKINYKNLKKIPNLNKKEALTVLKWRDQILNISEDNINENFYGLAVDVGTTTVVIYLLDLNTGKEVDINSFYNPQKKFGADVISRINYTFNNEDGIEVMQTPVLKAINEGIKTLASNNGITSDDIYKMSIVGNTIMLHLLLGIDALSIAKSPYVPIFTDELDLKPTEVGIEINEHGIIQFLPSISGYVGADITGDMLTINIDQLKGNNLMIDIGTNGEIVLNKGERIYSCSAAAGPAFEGANITFGTAGISGAISTFKIEEKKFKFSTINDNDPIGICGSGLLDMIAEFFKHGFIESSGKIKEKEELKEWQKEYLDEYKDQRAIKITEKDHSEITIYLTQKDIREVQLAKGAIAAGIEILLNKTELEADELDRVFIAGGFGNYINPANACFIKMIPQCLEDKIIQIGNGAGTGAKIYLLNKQAKERAVNIKEKVEYIELSVNEEFQTEYINSMSF
ncbi:MAG TPA: ASKHA domain-containing protein [Halanaerobiales bacterium]|nr:ASKHA domain-containing protein [Halanaerobiales bacterium]